MRKRLLITILLLCLSLSFVCGAENGSLSGKNALLDDNGAKNRPAADAGVLLS